MINTIALREVLQTELEKIHSAVYPFEASKDSQFPYIVYSWTGVNGSPGRDYSIDIDIYDDSVDETAIENLSDDAENGLNELIVNNENVSLIMYVSSRFNVPSPKNNINRIRVVIDMTAYFK